MKYTKKLLSLVLVLVLALALAVPGMAATITINKAVPGQTYNAYKIFDVTKSGESYAYTMSTENKWFTDVKAYATPEHDLTLTRTSSDETKYNVSVGGDFDAGAFAAYLNGKLSGKDADGTATAEGETVTIDVREAGYYFVDSSLGALCILNTAADSVNVEEKNEKPTIDKEVTDEDQTSASIGDTVNYKITVTAGGAADTTYVVHDKMSAGLTLNAESFEIKVGDVAVEETNYTINTTDFEDDCTFEITFNQKYTASLEKGTKIEITYSAVLNENAIVGTDPNTNEAKLDYGDSTSTTTTTNTYTYSFDLVKTDESDKVINGAQFKLYDADKGGNEIKVVKTEEGKYRVAKSGEEGVAIEAGQVTISGLANGTYWLEETVAPAGYNLLTSRVQVVVEKANNSATVTEGNYVSGGVQVVNQTGTVLPGTGGMGTTIFYTLGGVLVVGAAILLVTKKRVHDVEG